MKPKVTVVSQIYNSLQHWKYELWDMNSRGEVRTHPFHSFLVTEEVCTVSGILMVEQ